MAIGSVLNSCAPEWVNYVSLFAVVALFCYLYQSRTRRARDLPLLLAEFLKSVQQAQGFDIENEVPAAHRPFNPPKKSSLKMGLTRIETDQWLLIDRNLKGTLINKQKELSNYPDDLIMINNCASDAIRESYDMMATFLSRRYPEIYQLEGNKLFNKVMNTKLPYPASNIDMDDKEILKLMASNFEEDVLLLEYSDETQEYMLRAGSFVYPAGFHPQILLNRSLTEIHEPVPHYREKLQSPMNRFFEKIKPGQYVQRLNWSLQQGGKLAIPNPDEGKAMGRKAGDPEKVQHVEVNPRNMNVRVERQTLSRLPQTNYIIFTIRTYLYPIEEIRREGLGESLAQSIENLDFHMGQYKGRDYWGDTIIEFLRV